MNGDLGRRMEIWVETAIALRKTSVQVTTFITHIDQ
jgi:hypothetical protein